MDRAIARLATLQDGVIGRHQLLDAGLGRGAIRHRIDSGALTAVFRGVYAVGRTALTPRGWCRAALLAVGGDAVLSHRSAAYLWGLLDPPPAVHVIVGRRKLRPRAQLVPHTAALRPTELRHVGGLPVTSPLRTLTDLARDPRIERAVREAQVLRLVTRDEIEAAALLGLDALAARPTRSTLERAMLRIVNAAGLPQPLTDHRIGRHIVDFAWPAHRLVAETDGWAAHGDRRAFEADRSRDQELAAVGWTVIRFTWRQLRAEPLLVAARLAQALSALPALVPG